MEKIKIVIVVGPTASGKSAIALELADRFNGEIVSADSMQVYRHMDIGTAKPTMEQRGKIPHHLIDVANPDEEFTAARYRQEAASAINDIHARGKNIFLVGGTGLYIRALTKGLFHGPGADMRVRKELAALAAESHEGKAYLYTLLKDVDPEAAAKIHPNNTVRVIRALEVYYLTKKPISSLQKEHGFTEDSYEALKLGLSVDRKVLYKRIENRVETMMQLGFEEEVQGLLAKGYLPELKAMNSLGYRELIGYVHNHHSREQAIAEIKKNTKRYAKRQMTWFKNDADIEWLSVEDKDKIFARVEGFIL